MIKLIDNDSLDAAKKYCAGDPFGCRILAALIAYGIDKPFALFWAQYDENGSICAVISRLDTAMTICAKDDYDTEEMDYFVQAMVGNMGALRPVRTGEPANGLVMRLAERKNKDTSSDVEINPEISDLYTVMEECAGTGFEVPQFDAFYSDMIYRNKAKTAISAVLHADGLPASCGAMHLADNTAVLIMCASTPEHRGKGYTKQVVNALLDKTEGRDIYLMCLPSLHDFYEKFGFATVGGFVY
jgi:GNAT superfamily N-acetyltransferase